MKHTTFKFILASFLSICTGLQTPLCSSAFTTIYASSEQNERPEYYNQTITLYAKGSKNSSKRINIETKNSNIDSISFVSSDTNIVTVDSSSGKISAQKKGTAFITVSIVINGTPQTYTIKVNVKNPTIKITNSIKSLKINKSYTFKAKTYGLSEPVYWKVSNQTLASIDKKTGKVTAKKTGKVSITATCKNYSKRFSIKLTK